MDDPHLRRDQMPGPDAGEPGALRLGVVHAPYRRALDALAADEAHLVLAGHTHGGQVCVPFVGALVTNCDLPTRYAKGLHRWTGADSSEPWLHVSAGVGTSPYARIRFACPPEATLLTLSTALTPAPGIRFRPGRVPRICCHDCSGVWRSLVARSFQNEAASSNYTDPDQGFCPRRVPPRVARRNTNGTCT